MDKKNASNTCDTRRDEEKLPKSIDLSHHFSDLAKRRLPSPLKTFYKYYGKPGLLALAGGQ
jgi:aromatic amino acid aminotransferase I